jgi:hypothetical protein
MKLRCEMAESGACDKQECMHYEKHEDLSRFSCEGVAEYCDHWEGHVTCNTVATFA